MPWQQRARYLLGQPVGISFMNGTGTSGILCYIDDRQREIYVMEYLYQKQYATKHYPFAQIQDVTPFPRCYAPQPSPPSPPFPLYPPGPLY